MAAVLEIVGAGPGAMAMAIPCSSSSSGSKSLVVRGASTVSNVSSSSSFYRAGLPTCRGLKMVSVGKRSPGASSVRLAQPQKSSNAIVCEKSDTIHGATGAVTDQTFQKLVLDSDVPVLVDFWAPWCGPCRMIAPVIDELAKQYAGKLKCLKLNTDDSPYIATEYGIRSIPTVMIFKRGEKKDTVIGAVPKSTLMLTIDKYVDW